MKKIINGKVYSTDTATFLAEFEASCPANDFQWYKESLYRKKTGEFFLCGEGNGASRYASHEFDGWTRGEKIIPLSYKEARDWAEKSLCADDYEKIFSVKEDGEKRTASFYLSSTAIQTARQKSSESGMSLSDWLEKLIREA